MKSARQSVFDGLLVESTSKLHTGSPENETVVDSTVSSSVNGKGLWGFSENILYDPAYCTTLHWWWRSKFLRFEEFIYAYHWKMLSYIVILGLFCFGLKAVSVDTDFDRLWIEESDRLTAEWKYLAKAFRSVHTETFYSDSYYFSRDTKLSRMTYSQRDEMEEKEADLFSISPTLSKSKSETDSSLNSREFMGSMETILQTTIPYAASQPFSEQTKTNHPYSSGKINDNNDNYADILTPQALLDHMEFLIKVRRLTITIGSSKWSFKDLCQRASLPFGAEMHHLQAYLDMIIPCIIITPLDCFWEGAKVLGPEEAMWVPWFDERTLLQWTNIDPIGLLQDLSKRYGNYSQAEIRNLINLFYDAGINHGYLNRSCLDPSDPACPLSAPNYKGNAPCISEILSGGCPGFASKMLHWPEQIIVGGRVHSNNNFDRQMVSFNLSQNCTRSSQLSDQLHFSSSTEFNKNNSGSKNLTHLLKANSLQSLILLRSPRDLYEAVRRSDPYKHEDWTLDDARLVLHEWRRNLRRLVIEHNSHLQPNVGWQFFAFTNASLRDLLQEITLRLGPVTLIGCLLLVFLYGVVCLLGWRDPVRSQCWLALCGLIIIALSSVAGLGICAVVGIPFNVLTIQVLPFLLLGLGVDSIFVLTTCHECCISRRVVSLTNSPSSDVNMLSSTISLSSCSSKSFSPVHVLPVHGPSLLFGTIALAGAFFSAAFIPVPLIRQFCLQAGILILVQSVSVFVLFPVLLQLDETRRSQKRLDVLCCLRQLDSETTISTNSQKQNSFCHYEPCHLRAFHYHSGRKNPISNRCHCPHHHHHHCRHCCYLDSRKPTEGCDVSFNLAEKCISSSVFSHPTIQVNVVNHLSRSKRSPHHFDSVVAKAVVNTMANPDAHTVHTTVTVTGNQDKKSNTSNIPESSGTEKVSILECDKKCPTCQNVTSLSDQGSLQKCANKSESCSSGPTTTLHSSLLVRFARHFSLFITSHWSVQLCICILGLGLLCATVLCATFKLRLGLDWSSLTPSDTIECGFIKTAGQAFGLSNFYIIARGSDLPGSRPVPSQSLLQYSTSSASSGTSARSRVSLATVGRGIDFPMQQRRLRWMYDCLTKISGVMLSGRKVWLDTMRDWLEVVQNAFDKDRKRGYITDNGHWDANASELGVLGLRLIVQTDRGPELSRINTGRLVRGGIIDPPAFYTLLRVWRSKDALNFSSLPCVIYPEPNIVHVGRLTGPGFPSDLHALAPAEPIEFVQTSFYAVGVSEMDSQLDLVQQVRHITETATIQGVPAFPTGVPFTFAEHYIYLVRETAIAFGIFCSIILIMGLIFFSSPITVLLLLVIGAVGGACSAIIGLVILNLALNPISACLLLVSSGLGTRISIGFLGSWPVSHLYADSSPSQSSRKTFLCQPSSSSYGCATLHPIHFCTRVQQSRHDLKQATLSKSPLPSSVLNMNISVSKRRHLARAQIVRMLSNHFTAAFHATVGLLLSLSLLIAARVQFIADYFFRLIVIVSFVCLFNAMCLIPTICYLIGPLHNRFLLGGRRNLSNIASVSQKPQLQDDINHLSVDKPTHDYFKYHSPGINVNPKHHHVNMLNNDSQSSFSSSPSNMSPNLSSPSSSRSSSSLSQPEHNHGDDCCQNTKISSKTESMYKESNCLISRESTKDIVHHSLNYPYNHPVWMNPSQQRTSNAAATAAAAAVVVAAAAAASVRSRPPSLSTISEEPSHSNSTVSLNHTTPPNSGNDSTSNSNNNNNLPNLENGRNSPNPVISSSSVDSIKNYFPLQNFPLSLLSSVDLIRMSKLLNPNMSASEIYESLYNSITSPASSNASTPVKGHQITSNRELLLDPSIASTLLAAVTATSQTVYKPVGETTLVEQSENMPPPYSSVVSQSHSVDLDKCSERIPIVSHQKSPCMLHNTFACVSDNETSTKSCVGNCGVSDSNTPLANTSNTCQPNFRTTSSSKSFKQDYHQLRKKNVSSVFPSCSTHMYHSAPINASSNCKVSQLPLSCSDSSTAHLNVNIEHSYSHNHKYCSSSCSIAHCTICSTNNSNINLHHQSTSHSCLLNPHSDSQIKKSRNV
ncbi:Protein patched isoform 2 [Schistosoma japonicum]|uniref:Protein patched isoform 2 n=2 Tax=Schistosoma japonicum TaxID=6182 RepID=A0A4Z2CNH8_SCHJA|nr:Protein patched isoform 2 [Schistosoma japonicum]